MKTDKQSAGKSPVGTYEQLADFNHNCQAALALIETLAGQRMLRQTEASYYRAVLRELRASISQSVMEFLDQQEISIAGAAYRKRTKLEKLRER